MAREVVMAVSRAEKWGSAFSSWRGERVVLRCEQTGFAGKPQPANL